MSKNSLFSANWHRIRDVRPRLASDVVVSRHVYRKKVSYVFHRGATTACHRMDTICYELVQRLDGEFSVGQLWERAIVERDEAAPSQDEWIGLLAELHAAELIVVDRRVSEQKLFDQRQKYNKAQRRQRYLNPLYLRFALHDPDKWLNHCIPFAQAVFSRRAGLVWLLLLLWSCISMLLHSDSLYMAVTDGSILNARNALLFFLIYPPLKFLHELAHALAVKRAGGEVHETGLALMVLLPMPYVDASASGLFPDKYDRMLVGSAGIIVELACAAIGVLLWANTDGILQDIGLIMFMIGSVSTLLINGNPLLKFDGYYLLADYIEIPNLAERSKRKILSGLRSLVSGQPEPVNASEDRTETIWLYTYGVCSSVYRTVLILSIAWMLSEQWFFVGVMLAIYALFQSIILPGWRLLKALVSDPIYRSCRCLVLAGILPTVVVLAAFLIPVPRSSVVPGVVWIPDEAIIRVSSDCDVADVFVQPRSEVQTGDRLFTCEEPDVMTRFYELEARVDELQARRSGAAARDPLALNTLEAELKASVAALEDTRNRINEKTLTAKLDGLFDIVDTPALQGRSLTRGDVVAYVVPDDERTLRMAIDERWIARFDHELESVALRVTGAKGHANDFDTSVLHRTPKATRVVASTALSSVGGGVHIADESGDGRLLKEAIFDIELEWPEAAGSAAVGSHVDIRLVFSPAPLANRLSGALRQAFAERVES